MKLIFESTVTISARLEPENGERITEKQCEIVQKVNSDCKTFASKLESEIVVRLGSEWIKAQDNDHYTKQSEAWKNEMRKAAEMAQKEGGTSRNGFADGTVHFEHIFDFDISSEFKKWRTQ